MLAKVITLNHSTRGKGFGPVLRYILRADPRTAAPGQALESGHLNMKEEPLWAPGEDPVGYAGDVAALFDADVRRCRERGRFRGNPVYHVALNWREGEHPTAAQVERSCQHVMKALGFHECQTVWSIHRETDNDHVHLVINRVHPTKFTAVSVPRRDFLILDRCMRELELELGFGRTNGPYISIDTAQGPQIVRMSRKERAATGLLQDPDAPRLTVRAQRAEKNLGGASFQTWITGAPAARVRQAIQGRGARWQGVHEALAEFGCAIAPKGSGLVVTTTLSNGRVLAAKASILGRWASKASLERALGPYQSPSEHHPKRTGRRMESYEKSILRERLDDSGPRLKSEDPERLTRRAARAEARRALAERFEQEQAQCRADRAREREAMRRRHERERRSLIEAHRDQRRRARAAARGHGARGHTAFSIWAFKAAAEREVLQHRHAMERRALTDRLPRNEVWRLWLERQALAGDEAAKSALRGIRYREQRERHREDGIEGEEIADPRSLILGSLRIEVDAARLVVIYRRVDGIEAFRDTGPRIVMQDKSDESLEGALRVAAQKYGPRVQMTGSDTFQERAARMATRLGIAAHNPELQAIVANERQRLNERWVEPRSPQPWRNAEDRRDARPRSRGMER
jgi:hypothetical protein